MADELQFPMRLRGELREEYLDNYRAGLREMIDGGFLLAQRCLRRNQPPGHHELEGLLALL